jgi:hypothetical protein
LRPGTRHRIEAIAKLRALAIVDASLSGQHLQPSQSELAATAKKIKGGSNWHELFPGVASINIVATGEGPSIALRITKKDGAPVTLVKEGTPGASVVAVRRVSELDYYNLGAKKLAEHLKLTMHDTLAVVDHLALQDDDKYFKVIQIDSQKHKRYSQNVIPAIRACLETENIGEIVKQFNKKNRKRNKS